MNRAERFVEWAKTLNLTPDALEEEYQKLLQEHKVKFPTKTDEFLEEPVLAELHKRRKRAASLLEITGVITGSNAPFDIVKKQKDKATRVFDENSDLAVAQGLTDRDGHALWTQDTFSNMSAKDKRIGTRLPKNILLQRFFGVAKTSEGVKGFVLYARGDQVAEMEGTPKDIELNFKALDRTPPRSDIIRLNISEYTEFTKTNNDVNIPELIKECNKYCALANLETRITDSRDDGDRLVFTEGWMSRPLIPGFVKDDGREVSARLVVDHPDRGFTDQTGQRRYGVTGWLPKNIVVDFGEGSRLYLTGLISQGRGREDIAPSASLNVLGIYADPDYKVPIEIETET